MKKFWLLLPTLLALAGVPTLAPAGTLYVNTGGASDNSGSTDTASATLSGSSASWTTGTSTITLDGSPNLSGISTSGANQQSIYLNNATNTNQKIFWITAVDNVAKTVTVHTNVTCSSCTLSTWKIGGQYAWPSGSTISIATSALRAGDVLEIGNTPAAKTSGWLSATASGDTTSGPITVRGKAGIRPVIETSVTGATSAIATTGANWRFENLEILHTASSGTGSCISSGIASVVYNVKFSDCINAGVSLSAYSAVLSSEFTSGVTGSAISVNGAQQTIVGNYIHGTGSHGIDLNTSAVLVSTITNNLITGVAGQGIRLNGAPTTTSNQVWIANNTVYGSGGSGLYVADPDTQIHMWGNIFSSNGDSGSEYNVEFTGGTFEFRGTHGCNVFYPSPNAANLSGITSNTSESTSNPLFVDDVGGNYAVGPTSPAIGTITCPGYFAGGTSVSYLDSGAVQRQVTAGAGGGRRMSPGLAR